MRLLYQGLTKMRLLYQGLTKLMRLLYHGLTKMRLLYHGLTKMRLLYQVCEQLFFLWGHWGCECRFSNLSLQPLLFKPSHFSHLVLLRKRKQLLINLFQQIFFYISWWILFLMILTLDDNKRLSFEWFVERNKNNDEMLIFSVTKKVSILGYALTQMV